MQHTRHTLSARHGGGEDALDRLFRPMWHRPFSKLECQNRARLRERVGKAGRKRLVPRFEIILLPCWLVLEDRTIAEAHWSAAAAT
jgi:hypothetical protein